MKFPLKILRVTRSEDTRVETTEELLGRGVQFPSGAVVMEWYRDSYPPEHRLDNSHQSIYGSLSDLEQGTGGDVEIEIEL